MKLQEFQAKELLSTFGLPVPENGGVISKASQLATALKKAGDAPWVLKAQVQTGGRGKAGGIRVTSSADEAKKMAGEMLGMKLVTVQTGADGLIVEKLLIERAMPIARELYISITIDRKKQCPVLIYSAQGGMDIEELAEKSPEALHLLEIRSDSGLEEFQCRELLFGLGLHTADRKKNASYAEVFKNAVKAFLNSDASMLEINPLIVTKSGDLLCLDAKVIIDDNALFRHPELHDYDDAAMQNDAERAAKEAGISYIPLTGNIGCMVNGAGLAMATMDIIKQCGGEPANFLDVGGGAKVEQVTTAFKIILSDKHVNGVLVNIFGGIMKCDVIAQGIVEAVKQVKLTVPLVVRLQGNRVEEGRKILAESGLNITAIDDLQKAAEKAVELSK